MGKRTDASLDLTQMRDTAAGGDQPSAEVLEALNLVQRDLIINLSYKSPDGKTHTGALTNRVLGGDARTSVWKMTASILGGVPWESAPPVARQSAFMMAWLTFSLENPPKWFFRWAQEDEVLLTAVYEEVQQHESRYFRGDGEEGSDSEGEPRVQLDSGLAPRTPKK